MKIVRTDHLPTWTKHLPNLAALVVMLLVIATALASIPDLSSIASDGPAGVVMALLLLFSFGMYVLPSIIASKRQHPQALPIMIINLFLGWTVIGWVLCLAWACAGRSPPEA